MCECCKGLSACYWGDWCDTVLGQQLESEPGCRHPRPVASAAGASGVSVPGAGAGGGLGHQPLGYVSKPAAEGTGVRGPVCVR